MVILLTLLVGVGNVNAQVTGINVGVQSVSVAYGQSGTVTFTISFTRSGNGTSISGLSVISGLPSGVSASWSATSSTASGNHDPSPVTLTINTLPTTPVGSYQFTVSSTSPVLSSNGTLTVDKATPILSVTNTPQSYTGSPIAATVSGTGGGTVSNIKYDGFSTAPATAGTYAITADIAASTNYTAATGATAGNFVISKITPILSVTNTPQNYTGSPIAASVAGTGGGVVSNIKYNGSATVPTNAGTYVITADIAASTNYTAATGASPGDFVISPIAPTLSVGNTPQNYTGSPIAAIVSGIGGGTVSNIKYNGSTTAPTDAGTYAITADIAASTNYTAATGVTASNSFVINKATPTLTVTNSPVTYTGSGQSAAVSVSVAGTVSNILTGGAATQTNAGTYAVTANFAPTDNTNYNSLTGASAGNFVISPIAPTLSVTNTPQNYTGTPIAASVAGTGGGVVSNIKYSGSATVPTNAGTYAITADIAASTNYTAATGASAGDFVISPIAPTLSVTNTPQNYTGSPIAAIVSGTGGGTVSNIKYSGSATVPTNAGTYAITADIAASTNYTSATGTSAGNFIIGKAMPTVTVTIGAYTYNGLPQGPNAATNTGTGSSYTYSYVGVSGTTYSDSATPPTNAGSYNVTVTVSASADGNYDSASSIGTAFTIIPKTTSVTPNSASKVYGAVDPAFTGTLTGFLAGDNVTATYTRIAGETVAVSPYTISATLSPAGVLTNYTITYNTANFTIGTATPVVTPTVGTYTYNGLPQGPNAATNTGTGSSYTYSYVGVNGTTYPSSATPPINAGNYNVTATVAADANFNAATSVAYAFTINVATLTVTASKQTVIYGDATPLLTYTVSGLLNGDNESTAVNGLPALATTYTNTTQVSSSPVVITATIGTLSSSNYSFAFAGGTISITNKALTITASNRSKCFGDADSFNGNEFTSSGLINGDSVSSVTLSSDGINAGAAAGNYDIAPSNAQGSGLENYQINYTNGIFTVNPKPAIGSFN